MLPLWGLLQGLEGGKGNRGGGEKAENYGLYARICECLDNYPIAKLMLPIVGLLIGSISINSHSGAEKNESL